METGFEDLRNFVLEEGAGEVRKQARELILRNSEERAKIFMERRNSGSISVQDLKKQGRL